MFDLIFGELLAISTNLSKSMDFLIIFDHKSINFKEFSLSTAGTRPKCLCSIDRDSSRIIPPITSVFVISSMDFLVFK